MEKMNPSVMFATQSESTKITSLLRKTHQALDVIYTDELGHVCKISDAEIIADALHAYLILTRKAAREIRDKKRVG